MDSALDTHSYGNYTHVQGGYTLTFGGCAKGTAAINAIVNGVFDLTSELYNGRPLFRKRGDETVCLRFAKSSMWVVSTSADKVANNDNASAYANVSGAALPPHSGWHVYDGKMFHADVGASV